MPLTWGSGPWGNAVARTVVCPCQSLQAPDGDLEVPAENRFWMGYSRGPKGTCSTKTSALTLKPLFSEPSKVLVTPPHPSPSQIIGAPCPGPAHPLPAKSNPPHSPHAGLVIPHFAGAGTIVSNYCSSVYRYSGISPTPEGLICMLPGSALSGCSHSRSCRGTCADLRDKHTALCAQDTSCITDTCTTNRPVERADVIRATFIPYP